LTGEGKLKSYHFKSEFTLFHLHTNTNMSLDVQGVRIA